MSKSLEALQNIVKFFVKKLEDEPTNLEDFETNYSQVEQDLEILDIIKQKQIGITLRTVSCKAYEDNMHFLYEIEIKNIINEEDANKIREWLEDGIK